MLENLLKKNSGVEITKELRFILLSSFIVMAAYYVSTAGSTSMLASSGDLVALYKAQLFHLHNIIRDGNWFSGVDFLTSNGATVFSLRPNIITVAPFFLLGMSIFKVTFSSIDILIGTVVMLHCFAALTFCQLLGIRFFQLDRWSSLFFAVLYTFSWATIVAHAFTPFYLAVTLFPALLFTCLMSYEVKSKSNLFLLSIVYILVLLSGYVPLALFAMLLTALFGLIYVFYIKGALPQKGNIIRMFIPMGIAVLMVLPFYLALFINFKQASSVSTSLFFSAHQLAVLPSDVLSSLTPLSSWVAKKPVESMFFWGLIPLSILGLFVFSQKHSSKYQDSTSGRLFITAFLIYVLSLIIVFGVYLRVSDVFYYLFPFIGKMHIYQRYMLFTNFFFALLVALALQYITKENVVRYIKIALLISIIALFMGCYMARIDGAFSQYFIVELLLLCLFLGGLLVLDNKRIKIIATIFVLALALTNMMQVYDPQLRINVIMNNVVEQENLINFLRNNSNKEIIKYENLTSTINPYIPRNYPWIIKGRIKLSNYYGYEPHMGRANGYNPLFPMYGTINWDWLRRTGCQFIIYDHDSYTKYKKEIDTFANNNIRMQLSDGSVVVKLNDKFPVYHPGFSGNAFDNGYTQILHGATAPIISDFKAKTGEITFKLHVNDNRTRFVLPFWANCNLKLYINGVQKPWNVENNVYHYDFATPGDYVVHVKSKNLLVSIFLWFYGIYFAAFAALLLRKLPLKTWFKK
jgi:hypothetical protein